MNGRSIGSTPRSSLGRWTPAMVAGAVLVAVVLATVLSSKDDAAGSSDGSPPVAGEGAAGADTTVSGTPIVVSTVPPGFTTTTAPFDPITVTLEPNDRNELVKALQQRLIDLHFDPGPADGYYGEATRSAVWAYEKLVLGVPREQATGKVTPETWASMHNNIEILPKRPRASSTHLEVYLEPQVAVLFKDNLPILITHVSTGSGETWEEKVIIDPGEDENPGTEPIEKLITGTSKTPGGVYSFYRRYVDGDGWRKGVLGRMYKPVYFNYGVAVHGSSNVPNEPASHGCVRIPMHVAKYFPDLVKRGDQVFVFDGVKEPEYYGSPPPPFDQDITPSTTTTTSTTTTSVAATTSSPGQTTVAKTTTTAAPASSTTATPATTTTAAPTTAAATPSLP